MKLQAIFLSSLALGGAALLVAPGSSSGFTKIGGSLSTDQRDLRLFDNFADAQSNNNTTVDPQFPGYTGAELAIWKGAIEWQSGPHGNGSGDPTQANLGDGGANFDPAWMGRANAIGSTDDNVYSTQPSCGGGILAFTETPISNGWRIRFCDDFTWADGPGSIGGGEFDIQGVAAHEHGHALGLGHTGVGAGTMFPSVSAGSTAIRSIEPDDILGIQCVYGVKLATKPVITAASFFDGTVTLTGARFAATGNEVWFTNKNVTVPAGDPRIRALNVSSSNGGTLITVALPAGGGRGDVLVKIPGTGGDKLTNAFPLGGGGE